jgi:GGDEF domain-containing protein
MISIRDSVTALEQCHRGRQAALDCYASAIRTVAQYTLELGDEATAQYRIYLERLADEAVAAETDALIESKATLRGLVRDQRDRAVQYLLELREQLASSALALDEITQTLSQADTDCEEQLGSSLAKLRELADTPECRAIRDRLNAIAEALARGVDATREHYRLTISQLQVEIRMLHQRVDSLQAAAALDAATKFLRRPEIEEQIRDSKSDYSLLLMRVLGLSAAERQYGSAVSTDLAGAFGKRLRNCLQPGTVVARWNDEAFVAMLEVRKPEAMASAKWVAQNLSGAYACIQEGKTVRPLLRISVGVIAVGAEDPPAMTLEQISVFFAEKKDEAPAKM